MQLDLGLTTGTGPALVGSRDARLVQLAPFLLGTLRPAVARDTEVEREHRERRRLAQRENVAAQAVAQPTPADHAQQAEREQAPGSRAAQRQDTRAYLQDRALARRAAFRQTLAGVAQRFATPSESAPAPRVPDGAPPAGPSTAPVSTAADPAAAPAPRTGAPGAQTGGGPAATPAGLPRGLSPSSSPCPRPPVDPIRPAGSTAPAPVRGVGPVGPAAAPRSVALGRVPTAGGVVDPAPSARVAGRPKAPAAVTPAPDEEGNSDPNLTRIVRVIQAQLARERAVTTLRLDPPELGSLRLRLELQRDRLSVEMAAESPEARDLLERHLDALRRSLEGAGLQLERVVVRALGDPGGLPAGGSSAPEDARTAWQEAGPRGEPEAGRGAPRDAAAAEKAAEPAGAVGDGPATESLVNVWA